MQREGSKLRPEGLRRGVGRGAQPEGFQVPGFRFIRAEWPVPPADLTLGDDEVHVWRVHLDLSAGAILALRRTLAAEELARARRFHFEEDRRRFIAAHGALRDILGRYLRKWPQEVRFRYSPHGKPLLATEPNLHFNLAHTGDLALVAVARHQPVGVDIERIHPDISRELIAARIFSSREQAQLQALPAEVQTQAFFNCWTRKEAYVKARGEGLSLPLERFDVSLAPGEPARLLHVADDPQEAARWTLVDLAPAQDYAAALAVRGHGWRLLCWQWQPPI
ncbi:MAG: 4'-phosphopantetheinyl transferase superfamily protein [Anaerolineae bacterium]|nr:4'-phosphopantetheinyl transferase superfamily protein [Anaerolineae bacterium]